MAAGMLPFQTFLAACLLALIFPPGIYGSLSTIDVTTILTATSCDTTVRNCPASHYTISTSSWVPVPTTSLYFSSSTPVCGQTRCNADNCLRAFERGLGQQFCSAFTTSMVSDTSALPSYATACSGSMISRVSSACSCLNKACMSASATKSISSNILVSTTPASLGLTQTMYTGTSSFSPSSVTSTFTNTQGATVTSVLGVGPTLSGQSTTSQASGTPIPFTSTFTNPVGSTVTTVVQITPDPSTVSNQPTSSSFAPPLSFTSTFTNAQGSTVTSLIVATPTGLTLPPVVSSFTTTGTNSLGSSFTSIVTTTLSQAPPTVSNLLSTVSTFTTTGTNSLGSSFTSVVVTTLSQDSPTTSNLAPVVSTFASTGTDSQGSTFTSTMSTTLNPTLPTSSNLVPIVSTLTSVGTNSLGISVTSLISTTILPTTAISSSVFFPSSTVYPGSISTGTLTITSLGTNSLGQTTTMILTTVFPESIGDSQTGPTATAPPTISPPSATSASFPNSPSTTSVSFPSVPATTTSFSFPNMPPACSPFPDCIVPLIPPDILLELEVACEGTPILDCIIVPGRSTCDGWPGCLITAIVPDVCDDPLFPTCLFEWNSTSTPSGPEMTILPDGLILESTNRPDWTTNTLYTTAVSYQDDDGSTKTKNIILPVLVDSILVNGVKQLEQNVVALNNLVQGGLNTLGNVENLVGSILNGLIHLPGIPKFHIPCILFCHKNGGGGNNKKVSPILPPIWDELGPEPTTTDSSTSSCQTATATDCSTFLTVSVSGASTTTLTTSSCATVTACSVTASSTTTTTTTSASSTATPYFIVPAPGASDVTTGAFTGKLQLETDTSMLVVVGDDTKVGFWQAGLNSTQVTDYMNDPAVGNIFQEWAPTKPVDDQYSPSNYVPPSGTVKGRSTKGNDSEELNFLYKRVPGQQFDEKYAQDELRILSQPFTGIVNGQAVGVVPLSEIGTYTYIEEDPTLGRLYLVDSGATPTNIEYQWIVQNIGQPEWIYPGDLVSSLNPWAPYAYATIENDNMAPPIGQAHGTCMLSKMVGPMFGVAKNTPVTIVRLPLNEQRIPPVPPDPSFDPNSPTFSSDAWVNGLWQVARDIKSKGLQNKAIINLSLAALVPLTPTSTTNPPDIRYDPSGAAMYFVLEHLTEDLGAVVIVSSGNSGTDTAINGYPAVFSPALPLIVVGSSDLNGMISSFTQHLRSQLYPNAKVDIWAVGENIICTQPGNLYMTTQGTSIAAATVSGFIANIFGQPKYRNLVASKVGGEGVAGGVWVRGVKDVLSTMAYKRTPTADVPLLYNGEVPLNADFSAYVKSCAANSKRDPVVGCSAQPPFDFNATLSSTPSSTSAPTSTSSQSTTVAVITATVIPVQTSTTTSTQPTATPSSGPGAGNIQTTCFPTSDNPGGVLPPDTQLNMPHAQTAVGSFCASHPSTWASSTDAPVDATDDLLGFGIGTYMEMAPYDGPGGTCSTAGEYPRSLATNECEILFNALLGTCIQHGGFMVYQLPQGCFTVTVYERKV